MNNANLEILYFFFQRATSDQFSLELKIVGCSFLIKTETTEYCNLENRESNEKWSARDSLRLLNFDKSLGQNLDLSQVSSESWRLQVNQQLFYLFGEFSLVEIETDYQPLISGQSALILLFTL